MKKVLYLHGLESNQGGPKVDLNINLFWMMENLKPDLIIGSSMGGYVADILAQKYGTPAILFNPALHSRSFEPTTFYPLEGEQAELQERKIVVLGKEDKVIDPYLTQIMLEDNRYYEITFEEMGHQTPLNIFIDTINIQMKKRKNSLMKSLV